MRSRSAFIPDRHGLPYVPPVGAVDHLIGGFARERAALPWSGLRLQSEERQEIFGGGDIAVGIDHPA